MTFEDVIGQADVESRLRQMVGKGRLPHALMLCGPSGSGKMALALAFASYLLGADGDKHAAAMLRRWEHPDLHFSFPVIKPKGSAGDYKPKSDDFGREWREMLLKEGAYFTLNQWMGYMNAENQQAAIFVGESDSLMHKLSLKSSQGGYKICLMWLPERMNEGCANKILKLLEEPPEQTVFVMVSEEPERLLDTIRSRVQRIDVRKIDEESMVAALVERRGIDEEMARRVARVANGSWTKATEVLSADNENRQFLDLFIQLMRMAYGRKVRELAEWTDMVVKNFGREKQKRMLTYFLRLVRENFVYNFRLPELVNMTAGEEQFAQNFARFINERNVIEIAEMMQRAIRDISQNTVAKVVFFDMALNMIILIRRK